MKIIIIGATSAIAQALSTQLANQKNQLFLIGRDASHLQTLAQDYAIRSGQTCDFMIWDAADLSSISTCLEKSLSTLEKIDMVVIAHGTLPDQTECEKNIAQTITEFEINATSTIGLLASFAHYFQQQKNGTLIAFSSCAADRGRASNYLYGAAKSAISTFCAGLRMTLRDDNVHVITVKPGFVNTPMTASFKKNALFAEPNDVAKDVLRAIEKKQDVVYTKWFWKWIMMVVRFLPEKVVKKL